MLYDIMFVPREKRSVWSLSQKYFFHVQFPHISYLSHQMRHQMQGVLFHEEGREFPNCFDTEMRIKTRSRVTFAGDVGESLSFRYRGPCE